MRNHHKSETDILEYISDSGVLHADLRRQKEFYQRILENIPTDIVIFDASHRYIYVNPYAIKNEEWRRFIIGKDDFEYMIYRNRDPELAQLRREKFLEMKRSRKAVVWEDSTLAANGEVMTSMRKFYPVYDSDQQLSLVIGFGMDITEQKNGEEYVRKMNDELEAKIQERTNDLRTANEELNTFNSMVSHDLQTPLRALSGFAHILKVTYGDQLGDEGKELIEVIDRNAKQMSLLIKGLLKFAQLGKEPLTLVRVDMNEMMITLRDQLPSDYDISRIEFEILQMAPASCDKLLITQVWCNLIGNAIKYTAKKDQPKITIGSFRQDDKDVYYIKDNGAGFKPKYADKLFNIFQRLHTQQEFEGTGVGLAIVYRIIEKHGGRIWAESSPDQGASFYFTLR